MKKIVGLLLFLSVPLVAAAQIQLISGYNFGQFLGPGFYPSTDFNEFGPAGSVNANWKEGAPPPLSSAGDQYTTINHGNGTGALYWDGSHGSGVADYTSGTDVSVFDNISPAINAFTASGTNIALIGDFNGANNALRTVSAGNTFAFVTDTSGFSDFVDSIGNLTFAAQVAGADVTINWSIAGSAWTDTTLISGTSMAAYSVDLPAEFYGTPGATLLASFNGEAMFDNVQFNGFFGALPAPFLTFWKGGDGTWTAANTPANWRHEDVNDTEEGRWNPDGATATFRGTPGTVTVDNGGGAVNVTGMNFLVDGYTVAGGALTTTTAGTPVQVGDGTVAGSPMTATISAPITGSGGIDKTDLGTLVLSGANNYAGATTVSAGTLLVNGNQSAATGATTVASGATLGGTGSLGGSVTVQDGGKLMGADGGTLTMAGLTLQPLATLDVTLGAPSASRLFQVNGDLTLDGTLNVSGSTGFGGGLYRLIDFTGGLTDNGLAIGAVPGSASDFTLQTSVANQVNLIVDFSSLLWDGGDGTWSNGGAGWKTAAANDVQWTPSFAIFQSPGGTVTIDDSGGAVAFNGAQFATSGYTITGDALTVGTAGSTVRVGDGTAAGAGMTATIAAPLVGAGGINKRDLGTLVLTAANTFGGGTIVSEGTLQVGDGGTTGSLTGNIANNAVLAFNRSDVFSFDGVISGTGSVVTKGTGTTSLTGANTYSGGTTVSAGVLQGSAASLQGPIVNNAAVVFEQAAAGTYAGTMSGSGSLMMQGAGTLTLTGANNFTGGTTVASGTLRIGNGGTTGSLAGSIVDDGSLTFDRSNAYSHGGVIGGTGTVIKQGSGTTTFTGANTYSGATIVSSGTLLINGNQSSATGDVIVASGATLGGTGTTGGVVKVLDGGMLTGQSGSTFNMAGLVLSSVSNLNVGLGAPGTNALFNVNVGGDLTLDGVLNITSTPGFGEGLYRLFNYSGNLTDNGLVVGSAPVPAASFQVKTDVASQVNLLFAAAPLFWNDGATVWSASPSDSGWKDTDDGASGWQPTLAIFNGNGGTITVDGAGGAVVVKGVQFAAGGYTIAGGALTTNTADTALRVGDGTSAGAGITATISAPISGTGGIEKTDLGTLILAGNNTYSGGTKISSGTLQIASGSALGSTAGLVQLNGGTLRAGTSFTLSRALSVSSVGGSIDTSANNFTLSGEISGTGPLTKRGSGLLTISRNNANLSGTTTIAEGGVVLNTGSLGPTNISQGAQLTGNGTIGGNLANNGVLSPGASPGTINVTGNYTQGAGGAFVVDIASATSFDQVFITGSASLAGSLNIISTGGFAPQAGQVFKIIEAAGGVSGTFTSVSSPFASTSAMQRFEVFYNPSDVTLSLTQLAFAELGGSSNQLATGAAVDSALAAGTIPRLGAALNALQSEDEVLAALSQLSPLGYQHWFDQAVYGASSIVQTTETRMAQGREEEKGELWSDYVRRKGGRAEVESQARAKNGKAQGGLWSEVVRRQSTFDAKEGSNRARGTANGIVVGGDVPVSGNMKVGALFGYADENLDFDGDGGTSISRFTGAAYARYASARVFYEAVAGGSFGQLETSRTVDIEGVRAVASGSTNSREVFASARAGLFMPVGAATLSPYLGLQHTSWKADEFTETGAGDANLTIHRQSDTSLASRIGMIAEMPFVGSWVTFTPRLDLAWRQEFRGDVRLLSAILGGSEFVVETESPDRSGLIAGLGLDAKFNTGLTLYTKVSVERKTSVDDGFSARAGLDFRF